MTREELNAMTLEELVTIKANARAEEIKRLNFETFSNVVSNACIYGQMTGSCISMRARQIYPKIFRHLNIEYTYGIQKVSSMESQNFEPGDSFTPLEKYLLLVDEAQHKEVIKYLKGEVETIEL